MRFGRRLATVVLAIVPALLMAYAVRRSDGWRPSALAIERESLPGGQPEPADLEAMCRQAVIPKIPDLRPGACERAYAALEPALGAAAAKTLVQACNDKHAVFQAGAVHLPNASLCRQRALPPACRAVCGAP